MDKKEERYRYPYVFGDIMLSDKDFFGDEEDYLFLGYFEDGEAVLIAPSGQCCPKSCVTIVYPTLDEVYADEKMLREVSLHADGEVINYHDVAMLYCEIDKTKDFTTEKWRKMHNQKEEKDNNEEVKDDNKEDK